MEKTPDYVEGKTKDPRNSPDAKPEMLGGKAADVQEQKQEQQGPRQDDESEAA